MARSMEEHASLCPDCRHILRGVGHIRLALRQMAVESTPARFQLELSNCLEEARQRGKAWASRTFALGLALIAALAILLWPEQDAVDPDYLAQERWEGRTQWWVSVQDSPPIWRLRLSELAHSPSYSHAQVRPVSY